MNIKKIFKKYDIRGTVGIDFNIEDFYHITKAIIFYLKEKKPSLQNIALAMDGRLHSNALKSQVTNAILESGINVIFVGLCPSPALYYAAYNLEVDASLMITASHNPGSDNGLKILFGKDSIWDKDLEAIYEIYTKKLGIESLKKGIYKERFIINDYIEYLTNQFQHLMNLEINAILDCSNGTAGTVLPQLIEKMKWKKIDLLYDEVDGNFPNHDPDPTVEKNLSGLKNILKKNKSYDFALALDGDCDRLCVISKNGDLIAGDKLLGVFSLFLKDQSKKSIVFDVKCSNGLIELCKKNNIETYITPTGHAYIKETMKKNNAQLGGELSGHFCFNDIHFGYDDAIYAMLRLIEILKINNKSLDELLEYFPKKISSKEIRIPCVEDKKKKLIIDEIKIKLSKLTNAQILEIDGIRVDLPYGWGILRASNTEAVLSIRFEGNTTEDLQKIKNDFFKVMMPHFDNDLLKDKLEL